jgi:energy-coupling factor transporter ATP-binding protein EcfA2
MPEVQEILTAWLHTQADWLQQTAEIVLRTGSATDADLQVLLAQLKTTAGHTVTSNRTFPELALVDKSATDLRLVEIGEISGIENLGPRTPLNFGTGNLCVLYGHNGSGKSGYTRLLKKASGKPRAVDLKSNVFQPAPAVRQCKITMQVAGTPVQAVWAANGAPIEQLRAIDIFDTEAATVYLTQETAVAYTPPPVAMLESLVVLCDRLKTLLQTELDRLVSALPTLPSEYASTIAGKAYQGLRADSADAGLPSSMLWASADQAALDQLTERLMEADPAALSRKKRNTKAQVDFVLSQIQSAEVALSQQNINALRALLQTFQEKRRIATESAQVNTAMLDGIGSDTWRALWEAARAFSLTPYPTRDFPATTEARCLLCQQELDSDAQQRLRDFETFVQGTLETEAAMAEAAYQEALQALPKASSNELLNTHFQAAGINERTWQQAILAFWDNVRKVVAILHGGETTTQADPVEFQADVAQGLANFVQALETEALQHESDAAGFNRVQAQQDKLNLEARRWTFQQAAAISTEIRRLKQLAAYDSWKRSTNSRAISLKAGEIAELLITPAFIERFNQELKSLGAGHIKVELIKTKVDRGIVLHKLRLKGAHAGHDLPDVVLSEGERRIVGLAAFLADVTSTKRSAPFVFDDPISSLDHEYEWYVATRLAQLAQDRQVLVFTHRLSLYGAMEDAAKKVGEKWKDKHLFQHCIESFGGLSGHPADQAAWNANSTKDANALLLKRLDDAKRVGEQVGASAYRNLAQGICGDLRKLLERSVEDDLLNKVVKRHRRSITTENRLTPLQNITQADCEYIDELMTKYSCYEHSQSTETPVFIPEEPELRADLESLKGWREEFKKRPTRTQTV